MNKLITKTEEIIEWIKYLRGRIPPRWSYEIYSALNTFFTGALTELIVQWGQTANLSVDATTAKWAVISVCIRSGLKAIIEAYLLIRGKPSPICSANKQ